MTDKDLDLIGSFIGISIGVFIVNPLSAILFGFPALNEIIVHMGGKSLDLHWFWVGFLGCLWQLPVSIILWIISLAI
jgi:hypothetical protein